MKSPTWGPKHSEGKRCHTNTGSRTTFYMFRFLSAVTKVKQNLLHSLIQPLGKPPKQIFGKSWDFGPRRGGGLTQSQLFFKIDQNLICLGNAHKCWDIVAIWWARSSRLGQNPNFYRKFVLEASLSNH